MKATVETKKQLATLGVEPPSPGAAISNDTVLKGLIEAIVELKATTKSQAVKIKTLDKRVDEVELTNIQQGIKLRNHRKAFRRLKVAP